MSGFVVPVVEETNQAVRDVFESQVALSKQLSAMSALLERFIGDHPEAPKLSNHLSKLGDAKERMVRVNTTLLAVQTRLERLYAENNVEYSIKP